MTQEPKPGRRIVSKSVYARSLSKKVGIGTMSASFFALTLLFFLGFVGCVGALLIGLITKQKDCLLTGFIGAPIFFLLSAICGITALYSVRRTLKIDTGVPVSRANTADLPAPDSLVRASQEPMQAQQGVLLRAAVGRSQEEQKGQLLRVATGEQE